MADRTKISKFIQKLLDAGLPTDAKKAKALVDAGVDETTTRKLLSPEAQNITETALIPVSEPKGVLYGTERGISGAKAPPTETPREFTEKIRPGAVGQPPKKVVPVLNKELLSGQKAPEKPETAPRPMSEARKQQYLQRFEASRGKEQLGPKELTTEDFEGGPITETEYGKLGAREQQYLNRPDSPKFLQSGYAEPIGPTPVQPVTSGRAETSAERYTADQEKRRLEKEQFRSKVAEEKRALDEQDRKLLDVSPEEIRRRQEETDSIESDEVPTSQPEQTVTGEKRRPWSKYVLGGAAAAAALAGDQMTRQGKQPEGTGQTLAAKVTQSSAQVPVGGEGTKPSETKPTSSAAGSQDPTAKTIKGAIDKVAKGSGKNVPKDRLEELTNSLDKVEEDVNKDERFSQSPIKSDILQLRAEAYKLYKEKADRNEWMDIAERALNAIGQLASARSATGQQVGGLPLSRTDYGARTEQAFREYQADVGLAGEKVRGEEKEAERLQAAREREIARRRGTIEEKIKTERQARAEAGDTERARIAAAARENVAGLRTTQPKVPIQKIQTIDSDIKNTMNAIKAANRFAAAADDKSAKASLGGFLTATGLTPEQVDTEVKARTVSLFQSGKTKDKKTARQEFAAERVQELRKKLEKLQGTRESLVSGQQEEGLTAAPTGQAAPSGGRTITAKDLEAYYQLHKASFPGGVAAAKEYLTKQGVTVGD